MGFGLPKGRPKKGPQNGGQTLPDLCPKMVGSIYLMRSKVRIHACKSQRDEEPRQVNAYWMPSPQFEAAMTKDGCKLMYRKLMLNADNCAAR